MYNSKKLPHKIDTRIEAVKLYRKGACIRQVCDTYKISIASLMRWNARFDGTKASLEDKSHTAKNRAYDVDLRLKAVLLYRSGKFTLKELAAQYGFGIKSLSRWNARFDGTKESLMSK